MRTSKSQTTPGGQCEACGAVASEGRNGCQRLFDQILAREFGDYRFARLHRLTVDTYSLQHPEQYMRSGKSFVAHLTGTCAALERDDAGPINQAVQRWLDGPKVIERPEEPPPRKRGELTIVYLYSATDAEEHVKRVQEWARSTWSAWRAYHDLAKQWIDLAINQGRLRP
jgi:Family of unknown function (DUF5946)